MRSMRLSHWPASGMRCRSTEAPSQPISASTSPVVGIQKRRLVPVPFPAVVGLYGLIAYSVAQRTPELGLRIALGAGGRDVLRLVMAQSLGLIAIGVILGVATSLGVTRFMRSQLFQTGVADPGVYAASALLFSAVGILASYFPARRATRIEPADALRTE